MRIGGLGRIFKGAAVGMVKSNPAPPGGRISRGTSRGAAIRAAMLLDSCKNPPVASMLPEDFYTPPQGRCPASRLPRRPLALQPKSFGVIAPRASVPASRERIEIGIVRDTNFNSVSCNALAGESIFAELQR